MHELGSLTNLDQLIDVMSERVDVVPTTRLQGTEHIVEIQGHRSCRPRFFLDATSSAEDQFWALLEALSVVKLGVEAVASARWIRHLRSVS